MFRFSGDAPDSGTSVLYPIMIKHSDRVVTIRKKGVVESIRAIAQEIDRLVARLDSLYADHIDRFDHDLLAQDEINSSIRRTGHSLRRKKRDIERANSPQEAYSIFTNAHTGCRSFYKLLRLQSPEVPDLSHLFRGGAKRNPRRRRLRDIQKQ